MMRPSLTDDHKATILAAAAGAAAGALVTALGTILGDELRARREAKAQAAPTEGTRPGAGAARTAATGLAFIGGWLVGRWSPGPWVAPARRAGGG